jgi:urea transport system ATP-binding protein
LPFARRVAQQFCLMDRGRTVSAGSMAELTDTLIQRHLVV